MAIYSFSFFWAALDEQITDMGPIEPSIPVDQVSKEPTALPKEFEWCELDMNVEKDVG